jgi:tRNA threonylcarbamoyl adenosine modification protein YeaZ
MLLAIDTSTRYGGVALSDGGRILSSRTWHSTQNHTVELMPTIQELLDNAGVSIKEMNGIAVALGPGGFSALRVGLSVAKGLAIASDIPTIGVKTLEAEAHPHAATGITVCPSLPAGRRQLAWALFRKDGDRLEQMTDERLSTPKELVETVTERAIFCGESAPALADLLRGTNAQVAADFNPQARLEALAVIGEGRLARGQYDDVESLQPFYLRPPSIGRINTSKTA